MQRRGLLAGAVAALAGCATAPPPPVRATPLWPAPPEQPRYAWEATLRNGASLHAPGSEGALRRVLAGDDEARATFGKAMGVAARGGRIYLTDTEGRRVFVFDVPRRRVFAFGTRLQGQLKKPSGIAVDDQGRVYVVDTTARKVIVYDALGLYLSEIDGDSAGWVRPSAIAVEADGSRVHVVDTGGVESASHRVYTHEANGTLVRRLGRRGSGEGEFNLPADAAVAPDGTLWVLDAGNFRLQAFDREGRFRRAFGSAGNGLGQFARPRGLAIDGDGLLYVADALLCNVQVFQADGQLLLPLGARADRSGDAPGRFLLPARIATDETSRLYVVDQYLHKVDVLRRLSDAEGRRLMATG